MVSNMPVESDHFTLELLADGVYGCIEKPGGGAYSNAGIIDLADRTLVVDAFDTLAAGRDLRRTAEALFDRPVDAIVLTHPHSDHWIGASVFDARTTLLTGSVIRQICLEWGAGIMEAFQDRAGWEAELRKAEAQLEVETDERVRVGLERGITQMRYALAEMAEYRPRYADLTFSGDVTFEGSTRRAEVRSMGRGHSEEDVVVLLPDDGVAFIGDIGFFACQPFLGYCDIDGYRDQLDFFRRSDWRVLVPGHGPVGNRNDVALELAYMDIMEERVGEVVKRGGSFDEAMATVLPDPFDGWLVGGLRRFEANVRYLFALLGGQVPDQPA
jgi:glyoxylase-like metal-dependent hydrolase (beta-lactamase superfamily II)